MILQKRDNAGIATELGLSQNQSNDTKPQGERLVQQALRNALLKFQLHKDQELFEKAYGYIKQYY